MRNFYIAFLFIGLSSCIGKVDKLYDPFLINSQEQPAISGDGKKLAFIADKNGRPSIQLRDTTNGSLLPLRYFSTNQPHASPSLSWNGRYVAVIVQKGIRRLVMIEDRLNSKIHRLKFSGDRVPIRISLSPDASQIAVQFANRGKWRVELFDLTNIIDVDQPSTVRFSDSMR